jgi:hypothetical protein
LERSIDSAQGALKDLRKEAGTGSRATLRELDTALKDARKSLRTVGRTMAKEVESIGSTVTRRGSRTSRTSKPRASKSRASRSRTRTAKR